jgi:hypothetical protein
MFATSDGVKVNISSVVLGGWKLETNVGTVGSIVVVDVICDEVKIVSVVTFSSINIVVCSSLRDD